MRKMKISTVDDGGEGRAEEFDRSQSEEEQRENEKDDN